MEGTHKKSRRFSTSSVPSSTSTHWNVLSSSVPPSPLGGQTKNGRAPKDADYSDGYSPSLPALRCGFRSGSVSDQEHAEGLEFLDDNGSSPLPEHHENVKITAKTSQSIFLPEACVFVGNLARTATDHDLESVIEKWFSKFGQCWVKVLRNNAAKMPCAFVQYKTAAEALEAVSKGRGFNIFGRPCRAELARANRAVYVTRHDGAKPTQAEVYDLLLPFGKLEELVFPTDMELQIHDMPAGAIAKFLIFGESRDAVSKLQDHDQYHVRPIKGLMPVACILHKGSPAGPSQFRSNLNRGHNVSIRWLPRGIKRTELEEYFQSFGKVQMIDMITWKDRKPHALEAVVTYSHWKEAEKAVNGSENLFVSYGQRNQRVFVEFSAEKQPGGNALQHSQKNAFNQGVYPQSQGTPAVLHLPSVYANQPGNGIGTHSQNSQMLPFNLGVYTQFQGTPTQPPFVYANQHGNGFGTYPQHSQMNAINQGVYPQFQGSPVMALQQSPSVSTVLFPPQMIGNIPGPGPKP